MHKHWPLQATAVGVLIAVVFWGVLTLARKPVRQSLKIMDVRVGTNSTDFRVPNGIGFAIVLGFPVEGLKTSQSFRGMVWITNGSSRTWEAILDSTNSQKCNWLHSHLIDGYIARTESAVTTKLDKLFRPGDTNKVVFTFKADDPRATASLWLIYHTTRKGL